MLNLKDFLLGKKTVVEEPKKRPVGRPKKRPNIEEKVKEAILDIEQRMSSLVKKGPAIEISDSESDVAELVEELASVLAIEESQTQEHVEESQTQASTSQVVVKKESVEEPQAQASPNKAMVKRELIEEPQASPIKGVVKK